VLDVSNDVAAELASIGDGILDALRDRLKINILLRGNRLTIAGDDARSPRRVRSSTSWSSWSRPVRRSAPGPSTPS
jgi:hypothetical protein